MVKTRVQGSEKGIVKSTEGRKKKNKSKLVTGGVLQNKIDPSLQEYLEWLSTNWAEQVAEPQNSERPQPTTSSSSSTLLEPRTLKPTETVATMRRQFPSVLCFPWFWKVERGRSA